jgi:hypothetical protein
MLVHAEYHQRHPARGRQAHVWTFGKAFENWRLTLARLLCALHEMMGCKMEITALGWQSKTLNPSLVYT